jgi:hypothetical protein
LRFWRLFGVAVRRLARQSTVFDIDILLFVWW